MEKIKIEEWKPVVGYEGLYEVSSFGQIRSAKMIVIRNNKKIKREPFILKQSKNKYGYLRVSLSKEGHQKTLLVHRIVAQAFLPNPNNLPCVNHKTECKTFNHFSALEWCDNKYNNTYGTCIERGVAKKRKPVCQYTLNGELVREWKSASEVERETGFAKSHIFDCCLKKRKKAYNFKWEYSENHKIA